MSVIKSKIGRKFEQKRKAKWVKKTKQIWSRPSDECWNPFSWRSAGM